MNKPFLVLAGDYQYPLRGTGDWKGRFATREDAELCIKEEITFGPQAGMRFAVNGEPVDWIEIIDLRNND